MRKKNIPLQISWRNARILLLLLFLTPARGQEAPKKKLAQSDYPLWSTLESPDVSAKGNWASYCLRYASGRDTLFIRKTDASPSYAVPMGTKGQFCGERWHASLSGNDAVLVRLADGKRWTFSGMREFDFSSNGRFLFLAGNGDKTAKTLAIHDLEADATQRIGNMTSWSLNSERNKIAICTRSTTGADASVAAIGGALKEIARQSFPMSIASTAVWQKNSASLAFVLQKVDSLGLPVPKAAWLAQLHLEGGRIQSLDPGTAQGFPAGRYIDSPDAGSLKISDDGRRVFFQTAPDSTSSQYENPLVEVWGGSDRLLYSEQAQYGNIADWARIAAWHPDTASVFDFMPQETHVMLSGDQKMALTSSLEPCELQFKYAPDRDYYLTDLQTGERRLWMHCHSPEMHHTLMSPSGKQVLYYQDGNWHAYSLASGKQTNLTGAIPVSFSEEENDIGEPPEAYGLAGWTSDGRAVLLYDRYDLWEVAISGNSFMRLTRGREKQTAYRVAKTGTAKRQPFAGVYPGTVLDLNSELLLRVLPDDKSGEGFAALKNGNARLLHFGPHRIYAIERASESGDCIFLQEDYKNPASLRIIRKGKIATVCQSNPQHYSYRWGNVVSVSYPSESGKILSGLLYFPSDYEKGRKYPMIVRVYQKLQNGVHIYRNPADIVYDGFDLISFVNNGYFVLLPDMEYKMGRPGDSALFCTLGAVNAAVGLGDIDPTKIGLAGHSFGGFETSYIVTKTDAFAAAAAGAAITDLISGYLTVSENYKKAEFWRYEYYTNRIGKSLFEDFDSYYQNSSVFGTAKIDTPLLLWTGTKDRHVAPTQSMELYLALRRLGKKTFLLRYPNEDHNLMRRDTQQDLKAKMMDWFDHYLKMEPERDWMNGGRTGTY